MQAIDRILELTQLAQERADEGEWALAGTLDLERRRLLNELFAENDIAALPPETQELLRNILAQNNRIIDAIQTRKQGLVAAASRLNRAPGAVRAYQQNTNPQGWTKTGAPSAETTEPNA